MYYYLSTLIAHLRPVRKETTTTTIEID